MTQIWRHWLSQAAGNFDRGLPDRALEQLRLLYESLDGLPLEETMDALGTAAQCLEERKHYHEAQKAYQQLLDIAIIHHPRDVRTARDWVRLAGLYRRIGDAEREGEALESAARIYQNLDPRDQQQLPPSELPTVIGELNKVRASLGSASNLVSRLETQCAVLQRIGSLLRNDLHVVIEYPETLLQTIHNGLSPFSNSPLAQEVASRISTYLDDRGRNWCQLARLCGPGRSSWLQRQIVTSTNFPDDLRQFATAPDGRLLGFDDGGAAWSALAGEPPRRIAASITPRRGGYAVACVEDVLAIIDEQSTLHFFRIHSAGFKPTGIAHPGAKQVAGAEHYFVASFDDGRLVRFSSDGNPETSVATLAAEDACHLVAWRDGSRAALVAEAGGEGEEASILHLIQFRPLEEQVREMPVRVRSIQQSWLPDALLIGTMWGLYCWDLADEFPEKTFGASATNIVRSECGDYAAMQMGGIWVLNITSALQTLLPAPAGGSYVDQLAFHGRSLTARLHAARGQRVETWDMAGLSWHSSFCPNWIEKAAFTPDGEHLIGVSPIGFRYLWQIEEGRLIDKQDSHDPDLRQIVWSSDASIGAVCQENKVEILDDSQKYLGVFRDVSPHSPTWDHAGTRLAWAGLHDSVVRWAERAEDGFRLHKIVEAGDRFPVCPVLAPNGRMLAFLLSPFPASSPESGVAVKLGTTGRLMSETARQKFDKQIVLIDLDSGGRRVIPAATPGLAERLWFPGDQWLAVMDDERCMSIVELAAGQLVARFWAADAVVAGHATGGMLRLCDTGWTAGFGPVVYDVRLRTKQENGRWT